MKWIRWKVRNIPHLRKLISERNVMSFLLQQLIHRDISTYNDFISTGRLLDFISTNSDYLPKMHNFINIIRFWSAISNSFKNLTAFSGYKFIQSYKNVNDTRKRIKDFETFFLYKSSILRQNLMLSNIHSGWNRSPVTRNKSESFTILADNEDGYLDTSYK